MGYFVVDRLPGHGPWLSKDDPTERKFVVIVTGVPAAWLKTADQPEGGRGETLVRDPAQFQLLAAQGNKYTGALVADLGGTPPTFFRKFTTTATDNDSEYIEVTIALAFPVEKELGASPFTLQFAAKKPVPVPDQRLDYPSIMQKSIPARSRSQQGKST